MLEWDSSIQPRKGIFKESCANCLDLSNVFYFGLCWSGSVEGRTALAFPAFRFVIGILNSNTAFGGGYLNGFTGHTSIAFVCTAWWT